MYIYKKLRNTLLRKVVHLYNKKEFNGTKGYQKNLYKCQDLLYSCVR